MPEQPSGTIREIYSDQIIEPLEAMRTDFDMDKLFELAESIKEHGLINPITVRPSGDKYEIVAGHRRFRACGIASIVRIPCVVRQMSDGELLAMRAHENLFRDDIDPVDEALYVGKLVGSDDSKVVAVAKSLNRSVQWVEDRLNILTYPDYFLPSLKAGKVKMGVAKALAQIEDETYREMFFNNAVRDGMTVFQADYYLAQWKGGLFKKGEEILPPDSGSGSSVPVVIRQRCEKCLEMAESPNLKTVFIHIECPADNPRPEN